MAAQQAKFFVRFLAGLLLTITTLPIGAADRSPLNKDLPDWLSLGFQSRFRTEGLGGIDYDGEQGEDYLLARHRVTIEIQPAKWLRVAAEGQDARSFWLEQPTAAVRDVFDLREAYIGLGGEDSFWDLKVGRQRIRYGRERVIGAAEWANTGRVFDAALLRLRKAKSWVDIFSSSVVVNDTDGLNHHRQGNNMHGVYGSIATVIPGASLEPYVLLRTNNDANTHSWSGGLRADGDIGDTWSYELESIVQRGAVRTLEQGGWATSLLVQRHLVGAIWRPSIIGEFNFATGDQNPNDSRVGTYDQIYPTNHGIYGVADQVGFRNTRNFRTGVWFQPRPRLSMKTELHSYWLASRFDALYTFNGSITIPAVPGGALSTYVGKEIDVTGEAKLSPNFTLGAQYGHFFPGAFVKQNSKGARSVFYAFYIDFRI